MFKKGLSLILAAVMVLCMVILPACGSTDSGSGDAGASASPSSDASAGVTQGKPDDTVYNLVASTHVPGNGSAGKVFLQVLEEITTRSNGRIVFDVYTDGTLSDAAGALDALGSGMADVVMVNYSRFSGRLDLIGVCSLPGMFSNSWEGMKAMSELIENSDALQEMLADNGLKVIGVQLGTQTIIMSKSEVADLYDLAGKNVISGSSAVDSILLKIGANPVSFANSEAYEALSKGTVDAAASNSLSGNLGYGVHEVCKYMYNLPLGTGPLLYCMSQSAYDSLPADLQAIVDEVYLEYSADAIYTGYTLELGSEKTHEETYSEAGGTIIEPTDEQLSDFVDNICVESWSAWVENMNSLGFTEAQSVLDEFRGYLEQYEGTCPGF